MQKIIQKIEENIERVIQSNSSAVRWLLASFAAGGHVLLEDLPGTGKTTLAKALAKSVSADFKRIQCTPDLMPSDIVGVSIYKQHEQDFKFREGPVFTNILLADEINRASPRTQSALLEAMSEAQVSVEGETRKLNAPFFVVATQNPVEFHGTYPLPEAQLDRFMMSFALGYVSKEQEINMLDKQATHPLDNIQAVVNLDDVLILQQAVRDVFVSDAMKDYVVSLVQASRNHEGVKLGASPRASLGLMQVSQALALMDGQDFVSPNEVQEAAEPVIAHRLLLEPQLQYEGRTAANIVGSIVNETPIPR
ncbi:MAG: MoxR family ATPase [Ghiorsea sp.]|nr:MoxR family ATPase [Ghiorsea sp.]